MTGYTANELMVCQAARQLRNGEVLFVGIGLPNLACNLARRLHAPDLVLIYESGAVGAVPERLPISIGDPALVTNSLSVCSMFDVFNFYLTTRNHLSVCRAAAVLVRSRFWQSACW